jgi:hypothetical protein
VKFEVKPAGLSGDEGLMTILLNRHGKAESARPQNPVARRVLYNGRTATASGSDWARAVGSRGGRSSTAGRRLTGWQQQGEGRTLSELAFYTDPAAHPLDNVLDDRKTEAGAANLT